jgi:DNA-binding response OmpR family regulator
MNKEWAACPHCGGAAATAAARAEDGGGDTTDEARTYKALVVDDTPTILDVVRNALERSDFGLEVVTAANGTEALARAAETRPDIVVLDINMPGMDGFEVCRALRSDVRTAFVPVLMLTGDDSEDSMARGFGVGADDYMTKPVRREALVARVRRMLERTYGAAAVTGAAKAPPPAASPAPVAAEPVTTPASSTGEAPAAGIEALLAEVRRTVAEVRDEVTRALAEGRAEATEARRLAEQAIDLARRGGGNA